MADDTDTDWLALADFLDAHANDMRSWTEDEPKFRATAEGLRQLAAITAAIGDRWPKLFPWGWR